MKSVSEYWTNNKHQNKTPYCVATASVCMLLLSARHTVRQPSKDDELKFSGLVSNSDIPSKSFHRLQQQIHDGKHGGVMFRPFLLSWARYKQDSALVTSWKVSF